MLSYSTSVAIYHTAGKGTRLAPLPAAECNNKPGVVLPGRVVVGDEIKPITILEAVIRQVCDALVLFIPVWAHAMYCLHASSHGLSQWPFLSPRLSYLSKKSPPFPSPPPSPTHRQVSTQHAARAGCQCSGETRSSYQQCCLRHLCTMWTFSPRSVSPVWVRRPRPVTNGSGAGLDGWT